MMWTDLMFSDRTTPVARLKFKFNKQNPLYLQVRDAEPSLPRSFYNLKAAAVPSPVVSTLATHRTHRAALDRMGRQARQRREAII
jgi:hypothetical protein